MIPADNPVDCPAAFNGGNPNDPALYIYHVPAVDSTILTDSLQGISVTVFPNPSTETFTFTVNTSSIGSLSITVYNLNGSAVSELKSVMQTNSQTLTWNAVNANAGVYYYRASTADGKSFTGKLVKM